MTAPLLEVYNLSINFRTENGLVEAVKNVSLSLAHGGSLAIVGESGCGKSTLAKVLLGLETASSGTVTLGNTDIQSTGIEVRDVQTQAAGFDP